MLHNEMESVLTHDCLRLEDMFNVLKNNTPIDLLAHHNESDIKFN